MTPEAVSYELLEFIENELKMRPTTTAGPGSTKFLVVKNWDREI